MKDQAEKKSSADGHKIAVDETVWSIDQDRLAEEVEEGKNGFESAGKEKP